MLRLAVHYVGILNGTQDSSRWSQVKYFPLKGYFIYLHAWGGAARPSSGGLHAITVGVGGPPSG